MLDIEKLTNLHITGHGGEYWQGEFLKQFSYSCSINEFLTSFLVAACIFLRQTILQFAYSTVPTL